MKTAVRFLSILMFGAILICQGCDSEPVTMATSPDGVEIHFSNQGDGEPAIVLVHGWTNNNTIWESTIPALSEKYKVLGVDLAGHGQSGNNRETWTMEAFGKDIAAVVEASKVKKVVLVGFSMGGSAILEAVKLMPDKVEGLILAEAIHNPEEKTPPQAMEMIDSLFMDLIENPTKEKLLQFGFVVKDADAAMEKVMKMVDRDQTGWSEMLRENMRWSNEDCIAAMQTLEVPVVAINAEMRPTAVENFEKYLADFTNIAIPGSGHVLMWDNPEKFNAAMLESIEGMLSE
jgi:pimeloyl-ACP methyl ester carboxylesterase